MPTGLSEAERAGCLAGLECVSFEEIGEIPLKGILTPVARYRATGG